ncbi:MAG TPA: NAD(P)-binding domain-containing protein, partial [Candidatus Acidoferrales bacterium]|nr:NAD(P)-binding domain-containing protein [Candidatus Acidoferrales bacterium]
MPIKKIAILGAGSWGTALALALLRSRTQHRVCLWTRRTELAEALQNTRVNADYLPGFELPGQLGIMSDLGQALSGADIVLGVMPSEHARGIYTSALRHMRSQTVIVSATKGLDYPGLERMTQMIASITAPRFKPRVAALSGPSFASEVARGDPTAVVVASE